MSYQWAAKDPTDTVAYLADWADQLAALGGDTIASYTMVVQSGDATITKQDQESDVLKFWIAGGTTGTVTTFLNTVTTSTGQIFNRWYSLDVEDGASAFLPSTTTKRHLIEQAFTELALNGWEYDIDPAEKEIALNRLDMLMGELAGRGYNLNYTFAAGGALGDLDDALGCPDQAFSGLALMLAERLCPTMGKRMSLESRMALNSAKKSVINAASNLIPSVQLAPGTPLGAGNKPWSSRYPFSMS